MRTQDIRTREGRLAVGSKHEIAASHARHESDCDLWVRIITGRTLRGQERAPSRKCGCRLDHGQVGSAPPSMSGAEGAANGRRAIVCLPIEPAVLTVRLPGLSASIQPASCGSNCAN